MASGYDANTMEPQTIPTPAGQRDRFGAVYRVLGEAIAAKAFPGCAFGVLSDRNVVLLDALGRFTYEADSPVVVADTVYDVASLTKVLATTAATMLLYQCGRLDLEMPLGELLPGFVVGRAAGSQARKVTLRHLLAHSAGLPGYVEFFKTATTPAALFRACLELPLETEPGTRAEYSDPGFILLGKALEVLIREDLAAWVSREVFAPLGLAHTVFNPPAWVRALIPPTENDEVFRHRRIQGEVQDENAWVLNGVSGHAGLFSNLPDILLFAGEILQSSHAAASSAELDCHFSPETVQIFAERQGPEGSSRALGWDTPSEKSSSGRYFSPRTIGHLGYSGCSLWTDLDAGVGVALLTNRTWPDRNAATSQLIKRVRPAFHDAVRESLNIP